MMRSCSEFGSSRTLGSFAVAVMIWVLLNPSVVSGQTPDWVQGNGICQRFNEAQYLTGFGAATSEPDKNKAEAAQAALKFARKALTERIRVKIRNTDSSVVKEINTSIVACFSSVTETSTSLELLGLDDEIYFDDAHRTVYALAHARKDKLHWLYARRADELQQEIADLSRTGRLHESEGDRVRALDAYLSCYPLFSQLEEAEAVVLATGTGLPAGKDNPTTGDVRRAIDRLLQRPVSTLQDAAWYIIYCMKGQIRTENPDVLVDFFTYQDTRMGSQFSRYFKQLLDAKGVQLADWKPVVDADTGLSPTKKQPAFVLSGTYWDQPDGIMVLASVRKAADGRMIAGAEVLIPTATLESSGQHTRPENFQKALSDQRQFRRDETIGVGLYVEVWTNKGSDAPVFAGGEEMEVFVRVNMPCYLRILYHEADGSRTLLLDNQHIESSMVGKVYPVPERFVCSEPFGVEVLQVLARTERFEPARTRSVNGRRILAEDLPSFLGRTRGFKSNTAGAMQAERRLVLTTVGHEQSRDSMPPY